MATFTSTRTARKYLRELARHFLSVLRCPSCSFFFFFFLDEAAAGNLCRRTRLVIINSFRGLFIRVILFFFFETYVKLLVRRYRDSMQILLHYKIDDTIII